VIRAAAFAFTLALLACLGAAEAPRLMVETSGVAGAGMGDRALLRRVVAWRNGDVCIGRRDRSHLSLLITRVIEGASPPMREGPGTLQLDVVVIDDAAARAESSDVLNAPGGRWAFTQMPDGTPVVSAVADTAWREPAPAGVTVRSQVEAVRAGLRAADPRQRFEALRQFEDIRCFGLVDDVLAIADSTERIVDPEGGRIYLEDTETKVIHHEPIAVERVLGDVARRSLWRVTNALRDESSLAEAATAEQWRAWWRDVVAGRAP
jgi:hypothetical protein